ncbi:MAG: phosphotransferase [Pirellulaceae bacterium]
MQTAAPQNVLAEYTFLSSTVSVQPVHSAESFSGAKIWRLTDQGDCFCLRQWPPSHPDMPRLQLIHATLRQWAADGLTFIPAPLPNRHGQTIVHHDHLLYEVTPWMPGKPVAPDSVDRNQVCQAMSAMGQIHASANRMTTLVRTEVPLGIRLRHQGLSELCEANWIQRLKHAMLANPFQLDAALVRLALPLLEAACRPAPALMNESNAVQGVPMRVFPCARDIWWDHVLFQDDMVSGVIDFGSLQIDTPAVDLARYLSSIRLAIGNDWSFAFAAYRNRHPLSLDEERLVRLLASINPVLSAANWLKWLFLDGKTFPNSTAVHQRLHDLAKQLETASATNEPDVL